MSSPEAQCGGMEYQKRASLSLLCDRSYNYGTGRIHIHHSPVSHTSNEREEWDARPNTLPI